VEKPGLIVSTIWRRFLIVAKWTIGVLVVLGLLFIGINWFDEDLSPEAKALLIAPPNPYEPADNLYLALLGFDAKEGESPIAAAQAKVAVYEKETAAVRKDPQYALRLFPDAPWQNQEKLEFQGKVDFCLPLTKSCLAGVETHKTEIDRLLKANRELYRRYSRLPALKGYYETATPSFYIMIPYVPSPVRQLYLANIASRTRSSVRAERKGAITDLLADIRTWRLELSGSGSLISKMLAVAYLQGDYALLADVIADTKIDLEAFSPEIRSALELSEDDWKIGNLFVFEYRLGAFMWDQMRVTKGKWPPADSASEDEGWRERFFDQTSSLFIKINATQNLDAKIKTRLRKMADANPAEFFAARDVYRNWFRDNVEFGVHYAYNPFGKILLGTASSTYENYYLRAYDGAAYQRLVRLGYEIRSQRVEDKAVPSFMQQHPQWASHPVDGRPFVWDEKRREMTVQTLGQQPKDRRFSIPVWSAAPRK
jgi:hypothetical protein